MYSFRYTVHDKKCAEWGQEKKEKGPVPFPPPPPPFLVTAILEGEGDGVSRGHGIRRTIGEQGLTLDIYILVSRLKNSSL